MTSRMAAVCALLAALVSVPGCKKLDEGVNAYHRGEYEVAIGLLQELADEQAAADPSFKAKSKDVDSFAAQVPTVTRDYFRGWEAFAGSHFGLEQVEEGCAALKLALRPIRFVVNGRELAPPADGGTDGKWDPRAGDHWPPQAMSLRSWLHTIPCED